MDSFGIYGKQKKMAEIKQIPRDFVKIESTGMIIIPVRVVIDQKHWQICLWRLSFVADRSAHRN